MAKVKSLFPENTPDRSNERADVARRVMELSATISEAIDHMIDKLSGMDDGIDVCAVIMRDVGEGLISLENAVSAIAGPMEVDPEIFDRLAMGYDELTGYLDAMIDAYLEDRIYDFPGIAKMLRDAFSAYTINLSHCFGRLAVM